MKQTMLLMLLAMCVAHRKIDHFNIFDLLEPPFSANLICCSPTGNSHLGIQFRKKLQKNNKVEMMNFSVCNALLPTT
jgi:hypothetical protein